MSPQGPGMMPPMGPMQGPQMAQPQGMPPGGQGMPQGAPPMGGPGGAPGQGMPPGMMEKLMQFLFGMAQLKKVSGAGGGMGGPKPGQPPPIAPADSWGQNFMKRQIEASMAEKARQGGQ